MLQSILAEIPEHRRLDFLLKAYRPDREDVVDAILTITTKDRHITKKLQTIIDEQVAHAQKAGNLERVRDLRTKFMIFKFILIF